MLPFDVALFTHVTLTMFHALDQMFSLIWLFVTTRLSYGARARVDTAILLFDVALRNHLTLTMLHALERALRCYYLYPLHSLYDALHALCCTHDRPVLRSLHSRDA